MGTINYKTSDYITIGYNCGAIDYDDEYYHEFITDCYEQTERRLQQEYFYYFHVVVEPGYYEGFSIDVENNFPLCFDNSGEKRDAQKEITRIKKFLLECVNDFGCCAVFPGWCTGYANRAQTLKLLNEATKAMRDGVRNTPTWTTLPKSEKYA